MLIKENQTTFPSVHTITFEHLVDFETNFSLMHEGKKHMSALDLVDILVLAVNLANLRIYFKYMSTSTSFSAIANRTFGKNIPLAEAKVGDRYFQIS